MQQLIFLPTQRHLFWIQEIHQLIPIKQKGDIQDIQKVYDIQDIQNVYEQATSQVLTFAQMVDEGCCPQYHPESDTFSLNVKNKTIEFPRKKGTNLYARSLQDNTNHLVLPIESETAEIEHLHLSSLSYKLQDFTTCCQTRKAQKDHQPGLPTKR